MSRVDYRIIDRNGTILVRGSLNNVDGRIVHHIEFQMLLQHTVHLMVCIKLGRIEQNYKHLMDYGLLTLAALV